MGFALPEKITIWFPKKDDGFGTIEWNGPIVVPARKALKQEKFTDINGDQRISKAVCYTESPDITQKGAVVFFGESGFIEPPPEADDVRAYTETPSATALKKAWF